MTILTFDFEVKTSGIDKQGTVALLHYSTFVAGKKAKNNGIGAKYAVSNFKLNKHDDKVQVTLNIHLASVGQIQLAIDVFIGTLKSLPLVENVEILEVGEENVNA